MGFSGAENKACMHQIVTDTSNRASHAATNQHAHDVGWLLLSLRKGPANAKHERPNILLIACLHGHAAITPLHIEGKYIYLSLPRLHAYVLDKTPFRAKNDPISASNTNNTPRLQTNLHPSPFQGRSHGRRVTEGSPSTL